MDSENASEPRKTYFGFSKSQGLIKIGKSRNVSRRTGAHQTSCPDFKIILILPGDQEKEMHRRFHYLRFKGEWFRAEGEILDFLWEEYGVQPGSLSRSQKEGLARHFNQKALDEQYVSISVAAKRLSVSPKLLKKMIYYHPFLPQILNRKNIKWINAKEAKAFWDLEPDHHTYYTSGLFRSGIHRKSEAKHGRRIDLGTGVG